MGRRKLKFRTALPRLFAGLLIIAVALWFFTALYHMRDGQSAKGGENLETALRRTAVACYAVDGVYPPDLETLTARGGIIIDDERYAVFYEVFADNLMPDITVLEMEK